MRGRALLGPGIALILTAVAVVVGIRTGYRRLDVDEAVFRNTLVSMREGAGYYDAMSGALEQKEGAPPRSVRAVRPPTMFLFLRWFPPASWRWIVGVIYFAVLLGAWHLARPYGERAAVAGTVLAGVWVITGSPFLFLHAELWGLPFFVAACLALRREKDTAGAALMTAATAVRELFGLGLVLGLLVARRRRAWAIALLVVGGLWGVHAGLADRVVSEAGHEVSLGNEPHTIRQALTVLGPGDRPAAWVYGVIQMTLGFVVLVRLQARDRAARLLLLFTAVMAPAAVIVTRTYWTLTYGPAVAAFVPISLASQWFLHPGKVAHPS